MYSNRHLVMGEAEESAVLSAIRGLDLGGNSNAVNTYEDALAAYFGAAHAIACSSGTAGLYLALYAAGVGSGDQVLLPPTAPVMCCLPILALGAIPRFIDVESGSSFGLSVGAVANSITPRTRAVLSVPMWGYPVSTQELMAETKRWGVCLIEDCSHAHGTRSNGAYQGGDCDIAVFSTQERKLMTTGEGGFVLTNSADLARQIHRLRSYGRLEKKSLCSPDVSEVFGERFGLNFKLPALAAALGHAQLGRLATRIALRSKTAAVVRDCIGQLGGLSEWPILAAGAPNYYSFLLRVEPGARVTAATLGGKLAAQGFISDTIRYDYRLLWEHSLFSEFRSHCPNAGQAVKRVVTIPVHEGITGANLEALLKALQNYFMND